MCSLLTSMACSLTVMMPTTQIPSTRLTAGPEAGATPPWLSTLFTAVTLAAYNLRTRGARTWRAQKNHDKT